MQPAAIYQFNELRRQVRKRVKKGGGEFIKDAKVVVHAHLARHTEILLESDTARTHGEVKMVSPASEVVQDDVEDGGKRDKPESVV